MKARIQIPAGFLPVRSVLLGPTDRIVDVGNYYDEMKWVPAKDWEAFKAGDRFTRHFPLAIRRIARAKKWTPKGYKEITYLHWLADRRASYDPVFAYSLKGKRNFIHFGSIADPFDSSGIRFWLRKGAK